MEADSRPHRDDPVDEHLFQALFELSRSGIAVADLSFRFRAANPAYLDLLGLDLDELRGRDFLSVTHPDDRQRCASAIAELVAGTAPTVTVEKRYLHQAGHPVWVRATVATVPDSGGRPWRLVATVEDLSDLRSATSEAEDAARRLAATLESTSDAVLTMDGEFTVTFVNSRAEELLGFRRHELVGRNLWDAFPEGVDTETFALYRDVATTGRPGHLQEFEYPPLDTWFEIDAYPADGGVAVYFRDISRQRATRLAVEEGQASLRRQANLLNETHDAIVVRDLDHRITFWNRGAERVYGWAAPDVVGRSIRDLLPADPDQFDDATTVVLERGHWSGELTHRTGNGRVVVVESRWSLVAADGTGPAEVLTVDTDVTERRRIEQHLIRSQRLDSIGTLAGGIAHDLNNVLGPILLAAELLGSSDGLADDALASELLDTITTSARRGADLVAQVLSFARGVDGTREPVEIGELIQDLRAMVRDTFPKDVTLTVETTDDLVPVIGDRTQIQQVLLNLAVNARDAMPSGGRLAIRASNIDLDDHAAGTVPGLDPGAYVVLDIEDDGVGMAADVRERIFEPFFTTKPHGAGTGLGLSTVEAIVRSHGGAVRVYSEPGAGSRFRVHLPARSVRPVPADAADEALPAGSGQTVLVIDDEPAVRAMTRRALEAHGFRVVEAADGAEGVAVYSAQPAAIDLVLTDMMMPVMDGPDTIRALQARDPQVRIIGASGLHGNRKVEQAAAAGVTTFLPKPYTSRSLVLAVAGALGLGPAAPGDQPA